MKVKNLSLKASSIIQSRAHSAGKKGILEPDIIAQQAMFIYDKQVNKAFNLMQDKNHDYGEIWKEMRVVSLTDLIIQKLYRVKKIDANKGLTLASEGIDSNFLDIINYSIFALIHLSDNETRNE